jgi:polyhydroxyalkanoate synthesis regulator phasin
MTKYVDLHLTMPDDIYSQVVLPAKKNNLLEFLVVNCLKVYNNSVEMQALVDGLSSKESQDSLDDLLDKVNSAMGDIGRDISIQEDILSTPLQAPDTDTDSKRMDVLESKLEELSNKFEDLYNTVTEGIGNKSETKPLPSSTISSVQEEDTVIPDVAPTLLSDVEPIPLDDENNQSDSQINAAALFSTLVQGEN